jgi:HAD superfamily hydrolase (TIGR01509 family)
MDSSALNAAIDPALVRDVDLLSLDAGNTVIFLDHERLAEHVRRAGFDVHAAALVRSEGEAKLLAETGELLDFEWEGRTAPGARGWGATVGTMLARGGVPGDALPELVSTLFREHVALNYWSLVPPGLGVALERLRATGVRVAIVSNSEGMLDALFAQLGIAKHFDAVVDSGKVGVEKPDPRIFSIALERCAATAPHTLHLGDSVATDVWGARAAGIRCALIDPYDHVAGRHVDVPRVPGVVAVAEAILEHARGTSSERGTSRALEEA